MPTKHFSVQCDAVTIHSVYWQARKASGPMLNAAAVGSAGSGSLVQSPLSSNHNTLRR